MRYDVGIQSSQTFQLMEKRKGCGMELVGLATTYGMIAIILEICICTYTYGPPIPSELSFVPQHRVKGR